MDPGDKPRKPRDLISMCGKYRIIPRVDVMRVEQVRDTTREEKQRTKESGPLCRIVYSRSMYEVAMERAQDLIKKGHNAQRIEYVFAQRIEMEALLDQNFEVEVIDGTT